MTEGRFYEAPSASLGRSAPAALRNRAPIGDVLERWLPPSGVVLELASGTGEHLAYFAQRFPALEWQPSDLSETAIASIAAWHEEAQQPNLRAPFKLDAAGDWPVSQFDAILCINMAHISPWSATLAVVERAAKHLTPAGALIFYGPWVRARVETAQSNLAFDFDLKRRNPNWGIRDVEQLERAGAEHGLMIRETVAMPANNLMLLLRTDA